TLAGLGLSKKPVEILQAGHFQQPQTQEWETQMNELFEQIKAGF
ncbi:MAG: ABC transporter, partial [Roseovarius sp.]|nr:ABC transporter [Roseovarius sp.]